MKKLRSILILSALALPTAALAHAGVSAATCCCDGACPLAAMAG